MNFIARHLGRSKWEANKIVGFAWYLDSKILRFKQFCFVNFKGFAGVFKDFV